MASRTFEFKLIGIFFYFCPKIPQKKFQLDRPQIENFKASEHSREGCDRSETSKPLLGGVAPTKSSKITLNILFPVMHFLPV